MAGLLSARRQRKRRLKAEINVVPYIDVMLVMLIIFMATAPLLNLGTEINLPESQAHALSTPKEPVIVSIYPDGRLALKLHQADNVQVSPEQLHSQLTALVNNNPDISVLVSGDKTTSYQQIMQALDHVQAAGVRKVSLLSLPGN